MSALAPKWRDIVLAVACVVGCGTPPYKGADIGQDDAPDATLDEAVQETDGSLDTLTGSPGSDTFEVTTPPVEGGLRSFGLAHGAGAPCAVVAEGQRVMATVSCSDGAAQVALPGEPLAALRAGESLVFTGYVEGTVELADGSVSAAAGSVADAEPWVVFAGTPGTVRRRFRLPESVWFSSLSARGSRLATSPQGVILAGDCNPALDLDGHVVGDTQDWEDPRSHAFLAWMSLDGGVTQAMAFGMPHRDSFPQGLASWGERAFVSVGVFDFDSSDDEEQSRVIAVTPTGVEAECQLAGARLRTHAVAATADVVRVALSYRDSLEGCGVEIDADDAGEQIGVLTLTHGLTPVSWLHVASTSNHHASLRIDPWLRAAALYRSEEVHLRWPIASTLPPRLGTAQPPGPEASTLILIPDGRIAEAASGAGMWVRSFDFGCERPSAAASPCKLTAETSALGMVLDVAGQVAAESAVGRLFVVDFSVAPLSASRRGTR